MEKIRKPKASEVFEWLTKTDKRINFLIGGRDSTKSWSIALHLLVNKFFGEENKRILIIRKTRVAVKKSCFQLIVDFLRKYDCYKYVNINNTELEIKRLDNPENSILFTGLDDVDKLKSIEQGNYIWVEEAIDILFREFINLDILMRRQTDGINQMFLSTNPLSALSWIKTEIVDKPDEDTAINYSTIDDNPFASAIDRKRLDKLKDKDFNLYKIFRLSQWGILENIIYDTWKTYSKVEINKEIGVKTIDGKKVDEITYGLDFGFSNPSVLTEINWIENDFIVRELLYRAGLTNNQLIEEVKKVIPEKCRQREFYADPSEPDRIQEFYNAGFNIHKANPGVLPGIDFCKTHLLGVTADSINGIKELQSYKRKEDKDGNVMEEPVKFMDHFCDSLRYGSFSRFAFEEKEEVIIYYDPVKISPV